MPPRYRPRYTIEIVALGTWARGARLVAEYDARHESIRIDAASVRTIADRLGETFARRFVRYAIAHEHLHAVRPYATEAQAHAFARRFCGVDGAIFEAALRGDSCSSA